MIETGTSAEPPAPAGSLSLDDGAAAPTLEQRVARLEDAVDVLQTESRHLEERIERLGERPQVKISPAPREAVQAREPRPVLEPSLAAATEPAAQAAAGEERWLLPTLWHEARAIVRMFGDRRYRIRWTTWVTLVLVSVMIFTSHWWFLPAHVPVIGTVFDKFFDLLLAFVLYKSLSREARRYLQLGRPP